MNDPTIGLEGMSRAGYRLELLGESLAIEGREVRHAAERLANEAATAREQGVDFTKTVAIEAAANKLNGDVEAGVRHQVDSVRDLIRALL